MTLSITINLINIQQSKLWLESKVMTVYGGMKVSRFYIIVLVSKPKFRYASYIHL